MKENWGKKRRLLRVFIGVEIIKKRAAFAALLKKCFLAYLPA